MTTATATPAVVTIVDQQSPWAGCTVPVVATLPNGDVRVRVSELVIVGLAVGEFRPLTCPMCGSTSMAAPYDNGYIPNATLCRDCDARMTVEAATPGSEAYEYIRASRAA